MVRWFTGSTFEVLDADRILLADDIGDLVTNFTVILDGCGQDRAVQLLVIFGRHIQVLEALFRLFLRVPRDSEGRFHLQVRC